MSAKKKSRKKTRKTAKRGAGRPRAEVDTALIEQLAGLACTVAEIASVTGVSKDTLERNFAAHIEKGRNVAKASLRRRQWEVAMKGRGNTGMLIWLGKQMLGQRDRHEVTNLSALWDRMTPDELRAYAEQGVLPAWFPKEAIT